MKALLFVSYMVVLLVSFIPCGDSMYLHSTEKSKVTFTINPGQNGDHTDSCPPFCQCNCCFGISINDCIQTLITSLIQYHQIYPNLSSVAISNMAYSVWEPPKLSSGLNISPVLLLYVSLCILILY